MGWGKRAGGLAAPILTQHHCLAGRAQVGAPCLGPHHPGEDLSLSSCFLVPLEQVF